MSMSRDWIVKSEISGKLYGTFSSANLASKWATKNIPNTHWTIIRLRTP